MPTTSGVESLPLPQSSDAPDGPGAFLSLIQAMQTGGPWAQATLTALQALTGKYHLQLAVVNADPTPAKNGFYYWNANTTQWVSLPLLTFGNALIAPSSVAGTGVSVTNVGNIAFTNAPSASLNGIFTSAYDNYFLIPNVTSFSSSSLLQFNLRAAGSDNAAASYNYQAVQGSGATAGAGAATAATSAFFSNTPGGNTDCRVELFAPALPQITRFMSTFYGLAGGAQFAGVIAGSHGAASAFDGITLKPSAAGATMTGSVRVYGYNNG